jgi:hypothetical protein
MTMPWRIVPTLSFAAARVQHTNGQSTDRALAWADRFGHTLGLPAEILPRCGELQLKARRCT